MMMPSGLVVVRRWWSLRAVFLVLLLFASHCSRHHVVVVRGQVCFDRSLITNTTRSLQREDDDDNSAVALVPPLEPVDVSDLYDSHQLPIFAFDTIELHLICPNSGTYNIVNFHVTAVEKTPHKPRDDVFAIAMTPPNILLPIVENKHLRFDYRTGLLENEPAGAEIMVVQSQLHHVTIPDDNLNVQLNLLDAIILDVSGSSNTISIASTAAVTLELIGARDAEIFVHAPFVHLNTRQQDTDATARDNSIYIQGNIQSGTMAEGSNNNVVVVQGAVERFTVNGNDNRVMIHEVGAEVGTACAGVRLSEEGSNNACVDTEDTVNITNVPCTVVDQEQCFINVLDDGTVVTQSVTKDTSGGTCTATIVGFSALSSWLLPVIVSVLALSMTTVFILL